LLLVMVEILAGMHLQQWSLMCFAQLQQQQQQQRCSRQGMGAAWFSKQCRICRVQAPHSHGGSRRSRSNATCSSRSNKGSNN
jgi:hypothetical protein